MSGGGWRMAGCGSLARRLWRTSSTALRRGKVREVGPRIFKGSRATCLGGSARTEGGWRRDLDRAGQRWCGYDVESSCAGARDVEVGGEVALRGVLHDGEVFQGAWRGRWNCEGKESLLRGIFVQDFYFSHTTWNFNGMGLTDLTVGL